MNKKFLSSLGLILVAVSGVFYTTQNCGGPESRNLRSSGNEEAATTEPAQPPGNEPDEVVDEPVVPPEQTQDAGALLVECSGIPAEEWAELQGELTVEETQETCKHMTDAQFVQTRGQDEDLVVYPSED